MLRVGVRFRRMFWVWIGVRVRVWVKGWYLFASEHICAVKIRSRCLSKENP
jgi:hypothetical protein